MEDGQYADFNSESGIIYKQILNPDEISELSEYYEGGVFQSNGAGLATGYRKFIDINLRESHPFICDRLFTIMSGYLPDLKISPYARFYNHEYGGIKPHVDGNHDNVSNMTLLLYLSEDFDDGKLSIKIKRTSSELQDSEPDKLHKVFTFRPIAGYGICFKKNYLHWASEVYTGNKCFLLIHLYSS